MINKLNLAYFAGGAEFTLEPFSSILESKHSVKIIYTKKLKSAGKVKKKGSNELFILALKKNIETIAIDKLISSEHIEKLKKLKLDFIIVFSFGIILPKEILDIPKYGCINIHTSLLPKWRGASPIQHALLNNEKETGFTFISMNEKLDEGDIIYQERINIENIDNYQTLLYRITKLASNRLIEIIEKLADDKIKIVKQDNSKASYCYKIKKEHTYIKFDNTASRILGQVKAFAPFPGAKFFLKGELIKILEAKVEKESINNEDYGVVVDNSLLISCKKGFIRLIKVQREGKSIMNVKDLLNGWKVKVGLKVNAE